MASIISRKAKRLARRVIVLGVGLPVFAFCGTLITTERLIDSFSAAANRVRHQTDLTGGAKATDELPTLPTLKEPVDEASVLRESYAFAARHPEVVQHMPCFCACGRDKTHRSLEDCFIKLRGATTSEMVWNPHGGQCMICVTVASEARRLFLDGQSVADIRAEIERTLAPRFKFHTDTPMPTK